MLTHQLAIAIKCFGVSVSYLIICKVFETESRLMEG